MRSNWTGFRSLSLIGLDQPVGSSRTSRTSRLMGQLEAPAVRSCSEAFGGATRDLFFSGGVWRNACACMRHSMPIIRDHFCKKDFCNKLQASLSLKNQTEAAKERNIILLTFGIKGQRPFTHHHDAGLPNISGCQLGETCSGGSGWST